jgi:rubredoxin
MSQDFKKWQCFFCGYIYDEAAGDPEEGIPRGTRWADLPDDWVCPSCGAQKSDFAMMEVA